MRAFIAIELPQEIKGALLELENQLKKSGADVKWVAPQNIHLTIKFLGERDEKKINQAGKVLEEIASANAAYRIRISALGAFPSLNAMRVIWVGIDEGDGETKTVAAQVDEQIAKLGIPKEEREFSSHITLGRTRSSKGREKLAELINNLAQNFPGKNAEFLVSKLTLFQSTLTPQGALYTALKETNLKNT